MPTPPKSGLRSEKTLLSAGVAYKNRLLDAERPKCRVGPASGSLQFRAAAVVTDILAACLGSPSLKFRNPGLKLRDFPHRFGHCFPFTAVLNQIPEIGNDGHLSFPLFEEQ